MMELFNKKNSKILLAVLVVVVICTLLLVVLKSIKKEEEKESIDTKIVQVIPQDVRKIYRILTSNECYVDFNFEFKNDLKIKTTDMNDDIILTIIFNNLKENNKLSNNLTKEEYLSSAKEILGSNFNAPNTFTNFKHNDYAYTLTENNITKTKADCNSSKEYKTVLYSYSYNQDNLSVYINYAYIENDNVYDLDKNYIAKYSSEEMENIMGKATSYIYNFKKENKNYYLTSVEKTIREIK